MISNYEVKWDPGAYTETRALDGALSDALFHKVDELQSGLPEEAAFVEEIGPGRRRYRLRWFQYDLDLEVDENEHRIEVKGLLQMNGNALAKIGKVIGLSTIIRLVVELID